ncbi:hypothetical protein F5880DRAFT_1685334, partial [Lentinula raphanica]
GPLVDDTLQSAPSISSTESRGSPPVFYSSVDHDAGNSGKHPNEGIALDQHRAAQIYYHGPAYPMFNGTPSPGPVIPYFAQTPTLPSISVHPGYLSSPPPPHFSSHGPIHTLPGKAIPFGHNAMYQQMNMPWPIERMNGIAPYPPSFPVNSSPVLGQDPYCWVQGATPRGFAANNVSYFGPGAPGVQHTLDASCSIIDITILLLPIRPSPRKKADEINGQKASIRDLKTDKQRPAQENVRLSEECERWRLELERLSRCLASGPTLRLCRFTGNLKDSDNGFGYPLKAVVEEFEDELDIHGSQIPEEDVEEDYTEEEEDYTIQSSISSSSFGSVREVSQPRSTVQLLMDLPTPVPSALSFESGNNTPSVLTPGSRSTSSSPCQRFLVNSTWHRSDFLVRKLRRPLLIVLSVL